MTDELINVADLNQFSYCQRRYWYLHFYDTQGRNYERIEGKTTHETNRPAEIGSTNSTSNPKS